MSLRSESKHQEDVRVRKQCEQVPDVGREYGEYAHFLSRKEQTS